MAAKGQPATHGEGKEGMYLRSERQHSLARQQVKFDQNCPLRALHHTFMGSTLQWYPNVTGVAQFHFECTKNKPTGGK